MIAAMLGGKAERGAAAQERAAEIRANFRRTEEEIARTLEALAGGYVSPGGGGDPLRNPRALPTGRNLYGNQSRGDADPRRLGNRRRARPGATRSRARAAGPLAAQDRFHALEYRVDPPIRDGSGAHLYLLGVRPIWDHRSVVEDVELIPAAQLGRPPHRRCDSGGLRFPRHVPRPFGTAGQGGAPGGRRPRRRKLRRRAYGRIRNGAETSGNVRRRCAGAGRGADFRQFRRRLRGPAWSRASSAAGSTPIPAG